MKTFFGKYRGKVENNIDPLLLGRLQVSVPAVLGTDGLSWAMPCVPYAGSQVGFSFTPPVSANVWVEFEGGDPDYPIWVGCFWAVGESPQIPPLPSVKVLKTDSFTLMINETVPGAALASIELDSGAKLAFDPTGITLSTSIGVVAIAGIQITLNKDALVVLP